MMRIITGKARGVRLETLQGTETRPTSERAKEAVFSVLQFEIEGRNVLDLFAGSGQLGLEALSRGASHAVLVDESRKSKNILDENVKRTKTERVCTVITADAFRYLESYRGTPFDLVFLDPPYALGAIPRCLSLLLQRKMLAERAIIVCESGKPEDVFGRDGALASSFCVMRENRYGAAYVKILTLAAREPKEVQEGEPSAESEPKTEPKPSAATESDAATEPSAEPKPNKAPVPMEESK